MPGARSWAMASWHAMRLTAWPEKIFHDANAGLGLEDHHEHTIVVNIDDEEAELFPLLVDAIEVRLVHQTGDGLVAMNAPEDSAAMVVRSKSLESP